MGGRHFPFWRETAFSAAPVARCTEGPLSAGGRQRRKALFDQALASTNVHVSLTPLGAMLSRTRSSIRLPGGHRESMWSAGENMLSRRLGSFLGAEGGPR